MTFSLDDDDAERTRLSDDLDLWKYFDRLNDENAEMLAVIGSLMFMAMSWPAPDEAAE